MFESLMCDICELHRPKTAVKDGTFAGEDFDLIDKNVACLFLDKIGKTIPNDGTGRDIVLDGEFRMTVEPLANDKIEFNGYDYIISEVQEKYDIVTQIVQYYRATVQRQAKANQTKIAVI